MTHSRNRFRTALLGATALAGGLSLALAAPSAAQDRSYQLDLPAQPLAASLMAFGTTTDQQIVFTDQLVSGRTAPAVRGDYTADQALAMLLDGAGLTARRTADGIIMVQPEGGSVPQSASAGGDVDALIVTAQKREENIQDVPIAISAFSQEDLTTRQVAGGADLMTQVPNFTFTKTNFSSYSIQIRGIGTQAVSATVDPAVAVAFNNTPFIRNRFFEQEFYDLQRVEVLRGPQGTLYGRNATAGVVNIISAKPSFHYEAKLSGDVANYASKRLEGMVNLPLVEDKVALRLAGAWTKREGYVTNQLDGQQIDGRDLWSTRLSLRIDPTDSISANLIYEHFEEDDDRLRSGKQLCMRDPGPTTVGGAPVAQDVTNKLSQGCLPASLYAAESFQTPNGWSLPYYEPLTAVGFPAALGGDFYVSGTQSPDLRVIESSIEPEYKAKTDITELQLAIDLTPSLTLTSETGYSSDELFSFEDYNRFNTVAGAFTPGGDYVNSGRLDENGMFCDPQLGCSDRLVAGDLSTSKSRQFSQELRLSSNFDGPLNFSLGANFLRSDSVDKYYVFINSLSLFSTTSLYDPWQEHSYVPGEYDGDWCLDSFRNTDPRAEQDNDLPFGCIYMDPNPIGSLNDFGRNYFLSKNPYKLISYAAFGEIQYNITPTLKFTGGLRLTVDKKRAPIIPSWLLVTQTYGLVADQVIKQEWRKPTGRAVLDWKPDLAFTDDTMVYASYARGYKAGGANPPLPANAFGNAVLEAMEAAHPPTFRPEYINAFEVGTKNTLLDGRLTLNATAFYYDYTGYQISQIVDRSALNLNFDAEVWGAELEMDWRPLENLRLGFKGGYENTHMAKGSQAIDTMDRTAGHTDWVVVKPFPIYPSNCVLPTYLMRVATSQDISLNERGLCAGAYYLGFDPLTYAPYTPDPFGPDGYRGQEYRGFDPSTAPNGGAGFFKDLSDNELPNAPHFTATLTTDYTLPLPNEWLMTLHSDFYYQSEAWTRVFNTEGYDKLKAYTNVNFAAIFANDEAGWRVMAYVKNVFDRDSITGAFLNSDDTGLTTNVFLTEPRLYGVRITKEWTGGSALGGARPDGAASYPFRVEVGAGVERIDAPNEVFAPLFTESLTPAINTAGVQRENLDWSDSRDVKITYAPRDGWRLSASFRTGRANVFGMAELSETAADVCGFTPMDDICVRYEVYRVRPENYSITTVRHNEDFTIAAFTVGRDVGLGLLGEGGRSALDAGLGYAQFNSSSDVSLRSDGEWHIAEVRPWSNYAQHTRNIASEDAERRFEGAGPVMSWNASKVLLASSEIGRVGLDWSVTGGVLFGRQTAEGAYDTREEYFNSRYFQHRFGYATPVTIEEPPTAVFQRSRSATVPVAGLALGLSYEVERVSVSGGYRIDRYFDVIDGGVDTRRTYDRTIEGPYFKVSVGFGG